MRERFGVLLLVISGLLVVPQPRDALAVCGVAQGTEQARRAAAVRSSPLIVLGRIDPSPPAEAHGAVSFTLNVDRYLKGTGPPVIKVTSWGDGDLTADGMQPESPSAMKNTREFLGEFGGQRALVFPAPERAPFDGYRVGCDISAFGNRDVATLLPAVESLLSPASRAPAMAIGGVLALSGLLLWAWRVRRSKLAR